MSKLPIKPFELVATVGLAVDQRELVELVTPSQLDEIPSTSFVATFFGTANLIPVSALEDGVDGIAVDTQWSKLRVSHVAGTAARRLSVQPRYVGLHPSSQTDLALPVVVEEVIYLGHGHQITGRTEDGLEIRGVVDANAVIPMPGAEITLYVNSRRVRLVDDGERDQKPNKEEPS